VRYQAATALVHKGVRLAELGRNDEALAVYGDVVAQFGSAADPVLREHVAWALFNKAVRLGQLKRSRSTMT
jgi:hypothetical protein